MRKAIAANAHAVASFTGREAKMKRQVKISHRSYPYDFWGVYYVERKPRGRYMAAQFDAKHNKLADVILWVMKNTKLELVGVVE
jgi:hypothetical protein